MDHLVITDLSTRKKFPASPETALRRRDFYAWRDPSTGELDVRLEVAFSDVVEAQLPMVLDRITNGPPDLNDEDIGAFVTFVMSQYIRVPKQLNEFGFLLDQLCRRLQAGASGDQQQSDLNDAVGRLRQNSRFFVFRALMESNSMAKCLLRMTWLIKTVPAGSAAITSDNPVIVFNPYSPVPTDGIAGIGQVGTMVVLPLSYRTVMMMKHPEADRDNGFDPFATVQLGEHWEHVPNIVRGYTMSPATAVRVNETVALHADNNLVASCESDLDDALAFLDRATPHSRMAKSRGQSQPPPNSHAPHATVAAGSLIR